ncbi:MAG: hypothetical protein ABSG43_00750 [Solirubrobacteraceae bacterium]
MKRSRSACKHRRPASRLPWTQDAVSGYARFVSSQVRAAGLRHFESGAVARTVEHGARLAEDREAADGSFEPETLHACVEARLGQWARIVEQDGGAQGAIAPSHHP